MKKQKNIEVIITSHHIELHFKLLAILKQDNWLLLRGMQRHVQFFLII